MSGPLGTGKQILVARLGCLDAGKSGLAAGFGYQVVGAKELRAKELECL